MTATGFVYFVRDDNTGHVKVGHSGDPRKRLRSLQTAHVGTLTLLAFAPGSTVDESRVHRALADTHHRGEWFATSDDLDAIVDHVLRLGTLPPLPEQSQNERLAEILRDFRDVLTVTIRALERSDDLPVTALESAVADVKSLAAEYRIVEEKAA